MEADMLASLKNKEKYSHSSQEECCLSHIRAVCPGYFFVLYPSFMFAAGNTTNVKI